MEFFYDGHWRMDWGLGNPNKTAALIACLLIAVWSVHRWRSWTFWISLSLFAGLGVCLIHTYSRGGVVAAGVGLAVWLVLGSPWKHHTPRRWIAAGVILVGLVGYAATVDATDRYFEGIGPGEVDYSISNRLEMWRHAPQMMVDAPRGWGIGQSGNSYTQWYQKTATRYEYRTLVNSHLTWMVEFGWLRRFLYVACWLMALWLCLPRHTPNQTALPFAIWIGFAISATFSSVAESIIIWIPPVVALGWVVLARVQSRNVKGLGRGVVVTCCASVLLLATTFLAGKLLREGPQILHNSQGTQIGLLANHQTITLLAPDTDVVGKHFGMAIRQATNKDTSWHITYNPGHISEDTSHIVLSGKGVEIEQLNLSDMTTLTFLNPTDLQKLSTLSQKPRQNLSRTLIMGAQRRDPVARALQRSAPQEGWKLQVVPGQQFFLSTWVDLVLADEILSPKTAYQ